MRRREENNQDNRENTGKMSRLAKSVMAAGLAVGGATAFGDMSVFAAENGDGGNPGVTVDTNAQSDVEQHSVEIPTGAVSVSSEVTTTVSAPAPAAAEPAPAAAAPAPAAAEPAPVAATSAPATSEPALATTAPAPIVSESTSTTTPGTGNSVTTTTTEQNAGGAITVTKTETTYDPSTCTETKTETKTTTEIAPGGYDESTFGDKKTEETKKVTNPDGSVTITNQYTGTDGSTTTETITETKTPGTTSPTVISPSDGTKKDAVLVDENGNPVKDANGKNITDKVTDWEEKKTESTGETTTTTYVAITRTELPNVTGATEVQYSFSAIDVEANAEVTINLGDPVKPGTVPDMIQAMPDGKGGYTFIYGGKTYRVGAGSVREATTEENAKLETGTITGTNEKKEKESVEVENKETRLIPNEDGSFSFKGKDGKSYRLHPDESAGVKEGEDEDAPGFYFTDIYGHKIRVENQNAPSSITALENDIYQVTIDGKNYKIPGSVNGVSQVLKETENVLKGENGKTTKVNDTDIKKDQKGNDLGIEVEKKDDEYYYKAGEDQLVFRAAHEYLYITDQNNKAHYYKTGDSISVNKTENGYKVTINEDTFFVNPSDIIRTLKDRNGTHEVGEDTASEIEVNKNSNGQYEATVKAADGQGDITLTFDEAVVHGKTKTIRIIGENGQSESLDISDISDLTNLNLQQVTTENGEEKYQITYRSKTYTVEPSSIRKNNLVGGQEVNETTISLSKITGEENKYSGLLSVGTGENKKDLGIVVTKTVDGDGKVSYSGKFEGSDETFDLTKLVEVQEAGYLLRLKDGKTLSRPDGSEVEVCKVGENFVIKVTEKDGTETNHILEDQNPEHYRTTSYSYLTDIHGNKIIIKAVKEVTKDGDGKYWSCVNK